MQGRYEIVKGEFVALQSEASYYIVYYSSNMFDKESYIKRFRDYVIDDNSRASGNIFNNLINYFDNDSNEIPFIFSVYFNSFQKNNIVELDISNHDKYNWVKDYHGDIDFVYNWDNDITLLVSIGGNYTLVNNEDQEVLYNQCSDDNFQFGELSTVWTDEHGNLCLWNHGHVESCAYFSKC